MDKVKFTAMKDGDRADYAMLDLHERDFAKGTAARLLEALVSLDSSLSGYQVSAWFGLAAPAGLPAAVQTRLEQALERIAKQPEFMAALQKQGADPSWLDGQDLAKFMQADTAQWKTVADYARIQLD